MLRTAWSWSVSTAKNALISLTILMSRSMFMQFPVRRSDRSSSQALRVRIDHVLITTRERDQRQPGFLRQAHGECRRSRKRYQEGNADRGALLDHLVARAARDEHVPAGEIRPLAHQRADRLVERVVTPNVFVDEVNASPRHYPRRGVHAAGTGVDRLHGAELLDGRVQICDGDRRAGSHWPTLANSFLGGLRSTQAATGSDGEVAPSVKQLRQGFRRD